MPQTAAADRPQEVLRRAAAVAPAGSWQGTPVDIVVLTHDDRHRRRIVLTCQSGRRILLDLPEARQLADGDGLVLGDGEVVAVRAAPERLAEVRCAAAHELARVAWHLGNRHLPTQILDRCLRFLDDHVIVDMVRGLGVDVVKVTAPFSPEGGAYAHGAAPGDGHGHGHGHAHDHPHEPGQGGHSHHHDDAGGQQHDH